jgi:hypothetical protein
LESDAISGFVFLVGGRVVGHDCAAPCVSGIEKINVRGRDRNREAMTRRRRKRIRKNGKGKNNKRRVKWTSIYVRKEERWADDNVTGYFRETEGLNIQNGRTLAQPPRSDCTNCPPLVVGSYSLANYSR